MAKKQKIIAQVRDNSVFLIPVFLVLLIAPSIVYMRAVEQSELAMTFWKGGKVTYDFFCYYKTLVLRLCACFGILFFLTQKFLYGFKFKFEKKLLIPLLIFLGFGLISTVFSEYQEFAWLGFPDRFEGYLSVVSYAFVLYMVYDLADHPKSQKWFIFILALLALVLSTIGIFQYFYMDFFQTTFGKELILPSQFEYAANKLSFHQSNPVYMTLYQSNFAGSFTSIIFPMSFIGLFFYAPAKKWKYYSLIFLHLLIFSVWVACDSRAGLVGGLVALTVSLFFIKSLLKAKWKLLLILVASYGLLLGGLILRPKNILFTRYQYYQSREDQVVLQDLQINKNVINIKTSKYQLSIEHNGKELHVFDNNHQLLTVDMPQPGIMHLKDPRYKEVIMRLIRAQDQKVYFQFILNANSQLTFYYEPPGNFVVYDLARKKNVPLQPVPVIGGGRFDLLASNRGYIWTRGIPMLLNTLLIGTGFDTFAAYFPQYDFVGKSRAWLTTNVIIEKPHNFFLDVGLSAGVPALIALLIFLFIVLKKSVKLIKSNVMDPQNQLRLFFMIGIVGYLTSAQFNDSIVSVSIIFWILLGLLMNLNAKTPA